MRIQIRFEVEVPDDMTLEQAKDWVAFEVGERSDLSMAHPQMNRDLDPVPGTFFVWPE